MDQKVIDIDSIKNSLEELEKLSLSLAPIQEAKLKTIEKDNRRLDTVYSRILEAADEIEKKNFNLITEYSDASGYGAWNEEEKAFVDKTMLKLLFQDEGWVYTVVDLIACKISNQPLKVYQKLEENGKKVIKEAPDHPFNKVLELPNPMQSYFDWMYCIAVDLNLCGDAFLLKAFGTDSIYHLPSETMQIFIGTEGDLLRFDRFASNIEGGRKLVRSFAVDEIIHIRRPNASSFFQGFSPFTAGRKSILFNRYSLEYLNNYYLKGASSGLILELSKDANPANAQRLLRSFELAYLGRKNQRRVKILPQGVTAKNLGETLASQELKDYLAMNKEDILALLKVPKHEVGLQSAGSLGSEEYKTAVKNFWEATLKPAMGLIKGALNRKLADKLGESYFLDFDLSGVEALKDNEIQKGEIAKGMLQTHTINEVRETLYSLGKIEGGDIIPSLQPPAMPSFGFGLNPKPELAAPKEEEQPIINMPEKQRIEIFTDQAEKLIKASGDWFERRKSKIEEVTKKPMAEVTDMFLGLFADQAIEVIKNLDKIVKKSMNIHDEEKTKKVIDAAIKEQIRSLKEPLWLKEKAQIDEYVRMTFDHPAYAADQGIIDKIKEKTQKQAEAFIKERNDYIFELLNRKTSDDIYRIIANSSKTSSTITQLADAISQSYANPEKMLWRGERIARTEVLTILSKTQDIATKEAAKLIPGLRKMWISTFDNRTRGNPAGLYADSKADHWELHGQIRNENEDFNDTRNGDSLAFPRDPKGKAESVIQCRCTHIVLPAKEMNQFARTEREAQPNA